MKESTNLIFYLVDHSFTLQISFKTMNLLFCAFEFLVLTLLPTPALRISFSPRRASSKSSVVFKRAKESCLSLTSVFSCLKLNNTYLHLFLTCKHSNNYDKSQTTYIYNKCDSTGTRMIIHNSCTCIFNHISLKFTQNWPFFFRTKKKAWLWLYKHTLCRLFQT